MPPLPLYLLVINAAAFLAFALDFFLCQRFPALGDSTANALILDAFPIAGGAIGMLLALIAFGGLGRGHRMNKDNIAWWFLAIVSLVVWGLVLAAKLGLVTLNASITSLFSGWHLERLKILGIYLAAVNLITFAAFAWDKHVAATGNDPKRRVPEARLLGLSLIGGSIGGLLAMYLVRHKTQKWYFVWGLPALVALNVATLLYTHLIGLI